MLNSLRFSFDQLTQAICIRKIIVGAGSRRRSPISRFPSFDGTVQKAALTQTLLESTRTACAVQRYRLANNLLPGNLTELVPAFLAEVPKDPITGAPLL